MSDYQSARLLIGRGGVPLGIIRDDEEEAALIRSGWDVVEYVPGEELEGSAAAVAARVMRLGGFQRSEVGGFWVARDDVLSLLAEEFGWEFDAGAAAPEGST